MKKFLSTETLIRSIIVIVLIAFASTKYYFINVVFGLMIVFGMTLFGASMVRLYQEITNYYRTKTWEMSQIKTIILVSLVILIPITFLILLTPNLKIYSFLIVGIVLVVLLIYDLIKKLIWSKSPLLWDICSGATIFLSLTDLVTPFNVCSIWFSTLCPFSQSHRTFYIYLLKMISSGIWKAITINLNYFETRHTDSMAGIFWNTKDYVFLWHDYNV